MLRIQTLEWKFYFLHGSQGVERCFPRVHSSVLEITGLCTAFLSRMTAFVRAEIAFCSLLSRSV